jgi:lipid-binding SYLF domain-containing protein
LQRLYSAQSSARRLSTRSRGILIFPTIIKAGLLIDGQGGDGVLRIGGKTGGYHNIGAASFGLQADPQTLSYAMFFTTDASLKYLQDSGGWAIGSGPSLARCCTRYWYSCEARGKSSGRGDENGTSCCHHR